MGLVLPRIEWALAYPCPLRDPKDWHGGRVVSAAPGSVHQNRYEYNGWSHEEARCARDWIRADGKTWYYPAWGYSLNRRFPKQGGWKGLRMLCGSCPACTTGSIAGCVGSLYDDDHGEFFVYDFLEADEPDPFDLVVDRLGAREELARFFPVTNPLWFGLWINPVIPAESIPLLRQLFATLEGGNYGNTNFLRALETAQTHGLELHVEHWPNGFVGVSEPHCPRCKADRLDTEALTCWACGNVGPPQTGKWPYRRRYRHKLLLDELGEERLAELVRESLHQQEAPEEQLDELVEVILERERTRPVWEAEEKQEYEALRKQRRRERQFYQRVLYKGIRSPKRKSGRFRAPQFRQVLKRCQELGIFVTRMSHCDSEFNLDSYRQTEKSWIGDPIAQLDAWIADGCDEWFGASYAIPDVLLSRAD